jgi:hypothetical protein
VKFFFDMSILHPNTGTQSEGSGGMGAPEVSTGCAVQGSVFVNGHPGSCFSE